MPRIAASLAVLLTAVTCIGFNTARYPAVWQMLAPADGMARSDRSDDPATSPQSVAASQLEDLAPALAIAESSSGWPSDRQSDDGRSDSTDWEPPTAKPSSPYANDGKEEEQQQQKKKRKQKKKEEEEDSYHDSGESSYQDSHDGPDRDSDESLYGSDAGSYDSETASSPAYGQDELAGADNYRADADDEDEAAAGDDDASGDSREERADRVANRESRDQTASEPETNLSPSRFDPVAPADDPVEAPTSARYASYAFGTHGDSRDASPVDSGDAPAPREAEEGGGVVPKSTLVPVKPAPTASDGNKSLAARPWANSLSLPDHVGSSGTSEVIPLPPVDEVSAVAAPEARPPGTEDAIRIYPTTAIE